MDQDFGLAILVQVEAEFGVPARYGSKNINQISGAIGSGTDDGIDECNGVGLRPGNMAAESWDNPVLVRCAGLGRNRPHFEMGVFNSFYFSE